MSLYSRSFLLVVGLLVALGGPAVRPVEAKAVVPGVTEQWVDGRTLDLTVSSPSLGPRHANKVRLLLPPGWSRTATRTWPVLFLLHGGLDDYKSWSDPGEGAAASVVGDAEVITVLPGSGCAAGYMNWWNYGKYGTPAWERFHLGELVPLLERYYRADKRRAIAGASMGGFGAMTYAVRHPGMFRAVASYSGAVHTLYDPARSKRLAQQGAALCLTQLQVALDWRAASGDPTLAAERPLWTAYNPYDHVGGLAGARRVYVSSGDGRCGPLDDPLICPLLGTDPTETLFNAESRAFVTAAGLHGIRPTVHFYPGKHAWSYWRREFRASFPLLMGALAG